jgi:hypothetical protein
MSMPSFTGGGGFVGSSLAIALRQSGFCRKVTAFDNLHRRGSEIEPGTLELGGRCHRSRRHSLSGGSHTLCRFDGDLILECSAEPSAQLQRLAEGGGLSCSLSLCECTNLCRENQRQHHSDCACSGEPAGRLSASMSPITAPPRWDAHQTLAEIYASIHAEESALEHVLHSSSMC